jgi:hypothetical protein
MRHHVATRDHNESSDRAGGRQHRSAEPQARRAGDLAQLQREAGNRVVCDLLAVGQAKLDVGASDDRYEVEADQVAKQVVARLRNPSQAAPDEDGYERAPRTAIGRRAEVGAAGGTVAPDTEEAIHAASGGGAALPASTRTVMENAFGADFSQVRLHAGPGARQLNEQVQAKAFTLGSSIFFHGAIPDATTSGGQELLAHELTHTIQQGGAG